jgi:uncharacterized membrane protein YeaQ/YmgE (transglycosylase-associated protein family)
MNIPDLLVNPLAAPHQILAEGALGRGFIGTVVIGLIIGVIAKLITPGKSPSGCIITMLIGIAGSFIALYLGRAVGHYQVGEYPGFIASVLGAVLLLVIYHVIVRPGQGPKS